ncbi:MAG: TonB-dependent receptor [Betaproteobacteria bacterium]
MKHLRPTQLALIISALCAASAALSQTTPPPDLGRVTVEGQLGGTGTGLLVQEDALKARSSVNRQHLDTMTPTSNPYQAIDLLPGVSTFSYDATGLFGGGLRVRGANSDQMGFTVNGAPVNDSGGFAVYPQEYTDTENLCEIYVTQGSTDTEAPHVGASGGNVGMVTCAPSDKRRLRVSESVGELNFSRTFLRADTGKFANDMAKAYVSYSKADADKFKGPGKADKEHVDVGAEFRPSDSLFLSTSFLYNKMLNNNIRTLSYAQIAASGDQLDFGSAVPQHKTPGAGAQVDAVPADGYHAFNVNPFKNTLWSGKVEYRASKDLSFTAEPYFWYGYGTGGSQLQTLKEGTASSKLGGGVRDLNGDGDLQDSVMLYGSSVTRTYRPGVTLKTSLHLDNNNLLAGLWFERARHFQTGPRQSFDNSGATADLWLNNPGAFILHQDGTPYMARNQLTVSTASSLFLQDNVSLMQDRLNLQLGLRNSEIKREFNNYANDGSAQGADYSVNKSYGKILPSLGARFALDAKQQLFANIAANMKAPGNFSYASLLSGGTWVNGALVGATLRNPTVGMETSTNLDVGYRLANDAWTFSGSVYAIAFKNRIASAYDPVSALSTDTNVGDVSTKGVEVESGFKLNANWQVYGSLSYTSSKMLSDLKLSATSSLATAHKQMPDTPEWLGGISLNYGNGPWYGHVDAKFTGTNYSTLVNDQSVAAATLVNATAGYRFADTAFLKKPSVQLNVSNLLDKHYVRINSASGSSFTQTAANTPSYYVGATRFVALTLRSDF